MTGVVLAGGRSTRFGRDKMAEPYRGKPLLEHAVIAVGAVCEDVVIVLAPDAPVPKLSSGIAFRVARDEREGEGPLAGLIAGLADVTTELVLVVAGDMPGLSLVVLGRMLQVAYEADIVALAEGGKVWPLPCVLRSSVRETAGKIFADGERSLRSLLDAAHPRVIDESEWRAADPEGATLRDIDYPEDLLR